MKSKKWTEKDLRAAIETSKSVRSTLIKLNLVPAGGNYRQILNAVKLHKISTAHFSGKGWRKGTKIPVTKKVNIQEILQNKISYQTFKLKRRLIAEGYKLARCEICSWSKRSKDGRIPVELDHINGDSHDNRLTNLRILCPNCHSLQPTHRGRNKRKAGMV